MSFSTRCKLSERGAQSWSPRCPQSNHCLNPTGLKKHSWSRGTRALLHECLHFRRWTIIYLKLKPETQRSSLIPSPPACHVANQPPNLIHSVYEFPLQSGSLSLNFLLIQATVFNYSHNCSHVLGDVPSLKLSPSNPLSPHQTKEGPLESRNLITSLWWLCPPLSLDENELLSPSPARSVTCHLPWPLCAPSIRTLFRFLKLNPTFISSREVLASESYPNVASSGRLPQILTPRVLVPSHSITIADTPPPNPPPHTHIFNCYHSCNFYFKDCVHGNCDHVDWIPSD